MIVQGILFRTRKIDQPAKPWPAADFFVDLNLDQVVAAIIAGKEEYNRQPFFRRPCIMWTRSSIAMKSCAILEDGGLSSTR